MKRVALMVLLLGVGCSDTDPCSGVSGKCLAIHAGAKVEAIQQALIDIPEGGTVAFAAGKYDLAVDLSLDVSGVTIQGAGPDKSILSFAKQTTGAQGLLVQADAFTMRDIAVEDTRGDAVKILGADGVTLTNVRVEWTAGPNTTNGAYGLYPVQCHDVTIEDSIVRGASDSGVYVGQSDNIVVRGNTVENNVAGIEIENSTHADVHDNTATKNTGGILVFNLPGLEVHNGKGTRVFDNQVFENNTTNFAPEGNIVGLVPTGTGIAILAAHDVEVFRNTIHDHDSVNFGIISYVPTGNPVNDPMYDEFPTALYIHDNTMTGTSTKPTGPLGALLIQALGELNPNATSFVVPDLVWDGVRDPARIVGSTGDYADADKICFQHDGDADFLNLAWPLADAMKPDPNMAPHDCAHAPLPEVTLP